METPKAMITDDSLKGPRASDGALEFLSSIEPGELNHCLFSESLQAVSDSGMEGGSFTVSVQPAYYQQDGEEEEERCFLLHASSDSAVDGAPCGTSIVAYITPQLDTLEQHLHEYVKLKSHSLDKRCHMKRQGDKLVISRTVTEGQQMRQESITHELSPQSGFVTEASNLLIMRLLARRKHAENLDFLCLDSEMNLCISSYHELGSRPQVIGKDTVEVFGVERTIQSEDIPMTWQSYFLSDGLMSSWKNTKTNFSLERAYDSAITLSHMASRVQVGSPVSLKLMEMPVLSEPEEQDAKPVFEKKPLDWEDDAELHSEFLDRKEELISDHDTYLRRHPEMKVLLSDFMQFLLIRKPEDIFGFAAEFFAPFSSSTERGDSFASSKISNPFRDASK